MHSRIIDPLKTEWPAPAANGGPAETNTSWEEASPVPPPPKATKCVAEPVVQVLRPSALRDYVPPEGSLLVGDDHIVRGCTFVIGGAPGVGKSRASVALAVAGATQQPWFTLPVHHQLKTLIVQAENGRRRLRNEFSQLPCEELDDWVRVTPPPPFGLAFESVDFREEIRKICEEWGPDIVILDPWNSAAADDKVGDYLSTFKAIRSAIPGGDHGAALGIVAHTRKPRNDERANGRALLALLAGSYVLGSVPRSVFVVQAASNDPMDPRVVVTCCKNNDGSLGAPSAWERRNGLFAPVPDFDWDEFRGAERRPGVTADDMAAVFLNGSFMVKKRAVERLREMTDCSQSAAYEALDLNGRFKGNLVEKDGFLHWVP